MFEFKHIKPFDRAYADSPGPMVLFATPGMLHAGTSLEVFKKWAPLEVNMCILPGYATRTHAQHTRTYMHRHMYAYTRTYIPTTPGTKGSAYSW